MCLKLGRACYGFFEPEENDASLIGIIIETMKKNEQKN